MHASPPELRSKSFGNPTAIAIVLDSLVMHQWLVRFPRQGLAYSGVSIDPTV
jgi:hypothetical protein